MDNPPTVRFMVGRRGCAIIGDAAWLERCQYGYEYYVEQAVARGRIPRPFAVYAADRMFDQFVSTWRFLDVVDRLGLEIETSPPPCILPAPGGHCGPKDLVRYITAVRDHLDRAGEALRASDAVSYRLVLTYCKTGKWQYARYGVSAEEGQAKAAEAKAVLYGSLTRGAVTA